MPSAIIVIASARQLVMELAHRCIALYEQARDAMAAKLNQQTQGQQAMSSTILLERSLLLDWRLLEADAPSSNTEHNHLVFSLLDSLEEPAVQKSEAEHASELMRIDAKLNVIMQLLGQLLQSRQLPTPAVTIRFSTDTLTWFVQQPPIVGSRLQVSLYPDATIPLALQFEARVLKVTDQWMEVDMHGLGEEEQASWSRWVFRQHRRQVAQTRSQPAKS